MKKLLLLFCLLLGLNAQSWGQFNTLNLTDAPWVTQENKASLPKDLIFKGDFQAAVSWEEKGGKAWLVVSGIDHEAEGKNDLYVCQYKEAGGSLNQVWEIKDFSAPGNQVVMVNNSLQVLDLDGDGLMETSFIYHFPGLNQAAEAIKLMLHTQGKKLAIRGSNPFLDNLIPEKNIDPAVDEFPLYFKNFISGEWDEYMQHGEVTYTKRMLAIQPRFRLMELEYLMASGGTSYQLLDPQGNPLDLAGEGEEQINYASELVLSQDQQVIYFAYPQGIGRWDCREKAITTLATLFDDTEAVSSFDFSPSGRKMAFFALNSNYPEGTRLFVLTLDGAKVEHKQKLDLPTFRMAAAAWYLDGPIFIDENTIEYNHWTNPDDEGEKRRVKIE
ncbi:MAG: hypothetical protein H6581_09520 [Bacteroidia bacterium]|nr:hypothetical protein [Bacteroidia bacterium]